MNKNPFTPFGFVSPFICICRAPHLTSSSVSYSAQVKGTTPHLLSPPSCLTSPFLQLRSLRPLSQHSSVFSYTMSGTITVAPILSSPIFSSRLSCRTSSKATASSMASISTFMAVYHFSTFGCGATLRLRLRTPFILGQGPVAALLVFTHGSCLFSSYFFRGWCSSSKPWPWFSVSHSFMLTPFPSGFSSCQGHCHALKFLTAT